MKINEIITESTKQRIDPKCWTGYKKQGTKMKGGVRVNNCVPKEGVEEAINPAQQAAIAISKKKEQGLAEGANIMYAEELAEKVFDQSPNLQNEDDIMTRGFQLAKKDPSIGGRVNAIFRDEDFPSDFVSYYRWIQHNHGIASGVSEDWNKVNKKDKTSGMSQKAVNAYRRENPGSKLKTAVTTKPSKLKAGSKDAKRRKSFCARMSGNKGPMKKPNGKPTPKALALRRWNCESIEQMEQLVMIAEQKIRNLRK
jgi:hypothetical protein